MSWLSRNPVAWAALGLLLLVAVARTAFLAGYRQGDMARGDETWLAAPVADDRARFCDRLIDDVAALLDREGLQDAEQRHDQGGDPGF